MKIEDLDLEIMEAKESKIKLNISNLAKKYGISRPTVYEHIKNVERPNKERKRRRCNIEKCYKEIEKEIIEHPLASVKAIYMKMLLYRSVHELGTYSNFVQYVRKHFKELRQTLKTKEIQYRFETPPGKQIQIDWIEGLNLTLSNSEVFTFNIWNATLAFSRLHVFIVSTTKTEDDFIRCLVETIVKIGGKPKEILTDNMSSIVSFNGNKRNVHPRINQFMNDLGISLKFCKVRHPRTKGKNESANRFQSWLEPYDGEFDTKEKAIRCIENILGQTNLSINSSTQIAPYILFKLVEKSTLDTDINTQLLTQYLERTREVSVSNTSLISVGNAYYGVPKEYASKRVLYKIRNGFVFIYTKDLKIINIYEQKDYGIHYSEDIFSEFIKDRGENKNSLILKENLAENLYLLANLGKYGLSKEELINDLCNRSY